MPSVFGLTHLLFSDPQVSIFGAFGSFALLLLVDPPGRPRLRLASYLTLFVVGGAFIALGTFVSTNKGMAIVAMGIVGFGVLFAGIASPQAATSSTAALLLFVLPVTVAEPAASTGPRLVGWMIACAFCIPACMLVWPTPWHDKLRRRLSAAAESVSRLAGSIATGWPDPEAKESVMSELVLLRAEFAGTPYPPPAPRRVPSPWPNWSVGSSGWRAAPSRSARAPPGHHGNRAETWSKRWRNPCASAQRSSATLTPVRLTTRR